VRSSGRKTRAFAFFALAIIGLLILILAVPSYGAPDTVKPKYRLKVTISGVPTKIVLNQQYTYTVKRGCPVARRT
jgi:hypothetical protein